MNLMNDPIPNRPDIELNTKKAGGVAGKVDRDRIVAGTYIQVNNPNPPKNAVLTLEINPSKYTPEEFAQLLDNIRKAVSIIGDGTLKLEYYKKGSIKLFLSGSPEDITELQRLINSKELTKIEGHNISGIQETTPEEDAKISLIQRIIEIGKFNLETANLLERADLSSNKKTIIKMAILSGADLSGADLRRVYLRWADLIEANLSGADLSGADLSGADLSGADLSGADLSGADLSGAKLENATVIQARFGKNEGIDEALKAALIEKGAIFEDTPGERWSVLTPV